MVFDCYVKTLTDGTTLRQVVGNGVSHINEREHKLTYTSPQWSMCWHKYSCICIQPTGVKQKPTDMTAAMYINKHTRAHGCKRQQTQLTYDSCMVSTSLQTLLFKLYTSQILLQLFLNTVVSNKYGIYDFILI